MRWINLGRQNGKTYMMIISSFMTGIPILVANQKRRELIKDQAKKLKLDVDVYTFNEWITFKKGHDLNQKVLIDEAKELLEDALEEMVGCEVVAATTSIPMRDGIFGVGDLERKGNDSE